MFDKAKLQQVRSNVIEANNRLVLASRPFHAEEALCAIDFLSAALDLLGYDVVQRQTAQEAHDTMLSKRMAEDAYDWSTIGGGRV